MWIQKLCPFPLKKMWTNTLSWISALVILLRKMVTSLEQKPGCLSFPLAGQPSVLSRLISLIRMNNLSYDNRPGSKSLSKASQIINLLKAPLIV